MHLLDDEQYTIVDLSENTAADSDWSNCWDRVGECLIENVNHPSQGQHKASRDSSAHKPGARHMIQYAGRLAGKPTKSVTLPTALLCKLQVKTMLLSCSVVVLVSNGNGLCRNLCDSLVIFSMPSYLFVPKICGPTHLDSVLVSSCKLVLVRHRQHQHKRAAPALDLIDVSACLANYCSRIPVKQNSPHDVVGGCYMLQHTDTNSLTCLEWSSCAGT